MVCIPQHDFKPNTRPSLLPVLADGFPAELRPYDHFVDWRAVWKPDKGKYDKVPVNARTGGPASSTDPETWSTLDEALDAYRTPGPAGRLDGIGFVVSKAEATADPFVVGDLDRCRDPQTGIVEEWALRIIRQINTYTEFSPSGTGLRFLARGRLPPHGRRKGQVELYEHARFVTITGHRLDGTPTGVEDRADALLGLHRKVFGTGQATRPAARCQSVDADDEKLLARIRRSRCGAKFDRLWSGEITGYDSWSQADLALANILRFFAGNDPARVDTLFRRSGLMRTKWDERRGSTTYGARTIALAMAG
jgi:primase-polymerase (primpol)-like protein